MSEHQVPRWALVLMLGAVLAGTLAGFAIGGRGVILEVALPLLMGAVCVEQLRTAQPSARWTVPLLTIASLLSAVLRSGPTPARLVLAALLSALVLFGSVTGRRTLAIVATCFGCGYCAMMRYESAQPLGRMERPGGAMGAELRALDADARPLDGLRVGEAVEGRQLGLFRASGAVRAARPHTEARQRRPQAWRTLLNLFENLF
jgi:hypothetical protein